MQVIGNTKVTLPSKFGICFLNIRVNDDYNEVQNFKNRLETSILIRIVLSIELAENIFIESHLGLDLI